MIKITGNKRQFRGKKLGGMPKKTLNGFRQAQKKVNILNKYREEPRFSTLLKSGAKELKMTRLSDVIRSHKSEIMDRFVQKKKNWFQRFLDRARETLYDPNNPIMVDLMIRLKYDTLSNLKIEAEYGDSY